MGKPLPGGTIQFHPQGQGNPAYGVIKEDGTYTVTTYARGDGAVLGEHIVTITIHAGQGELPGAPGKKAAIPKKYSDQKQSPLKATIERGSNTKDFKLEK